MLYKKVLFVAIAMLFSFNNAHAQFFKKLMKTVQEVGEVVTEITGETSDGTPVNSNTTTSSNFNSSQNNTAPATTTKADDGSFSMSLNAPGYEIKLLVAIAQVIWQLTILLFSTRQVKLAKFTLLPKKDVQAMRNIEHLLLMINTRYIIIKRR